MKKDIFMRAKAGTIIFSFPIENEAKDWENRIASKLKGDGYKIKDAGRGGEATRETQDIFRQDTNSWHPKSLYMIIHMLILGETIVF